jgi:hypothetical protein
MPSRNADFNLDDGYLYNRDCVTIRASDKSQRYQRYRHDERRDDAIIDRGNCGDRK